MDWKLFGTVFGTVLLTEIGDKTQLAVLTFASGSGSRLAVFLGGTTALALTTLVAVLIGDALSNVVPVRVLHILAAVSFVVIGIVMLIRTLKPA
jgi:putative Ca2+/H+ antiporter (TMEM165/GDT1 family)